MSNWPALDPSVQVIEHGTDARGNATVIVHSSASSFLASQCVGDIIVALRNGAASSAEVFALLPERSRAVLTPELVESFVATSIPARLLRGAGSTPRTPSFAFSATILPAEWVGWIGQQLRFLFVGRTAVWAAALAVMACLLPFVVGSMRSAPGQPISPLLAVAGVVVILLCHELGHATACVANGVKPGRVGAGVYWFFPVLFTDVTNSWALPRAKRMVVSASGFYFQLIATGIVVAVLSSQHPRAAIWIVWLSAFSALHMLNPVFKMDGYWLLSDALAIPNMHRSLWKRVRATVGQWWRMLSRQTASLPDDEAPQPYVLFPWQLAVLGAYAGVSLLYIGVLMHRMIDASLQAIASWPEIRTSIARMPRVLDTSQPVAQKLAMLVPLVEPAVAPLLLGLVWLFLARQVMRGLHPARATTTITS